MIQTVNRYAFEDAFNKSDTYKNNFSYEGKKALFEYLENLEEETDEQIELDIVALCCDYTEYDNVIEAGHEYFACPSEPEGTLEENEKLCRDFLNDNTQVIEFDKGVIIQNF